jgi:pimeloyl-ACP methyl ester carboxylesterase
MAHVVFVHGAWVGPDSWDRVAPLVQRAGHTTEAVTLPLTGLADDAAVARKAVEKALGDDVVLVGHSYGGTVITAAGADQPRVRRLVYVAAVGNTADESANDLVGLFPPTPAGPYIQVDEQSRMTIQPDKFGEVFAQDVDPAITAELGHRQNPTHTDCFADKLPGTPAWRTVPSIFLVSTADRVVSPLLQAYEAGRMGATVITLDASHASPLSQPQAIADAITT